MVNSDSYLLLIIIKSIVFIFTQCGVTTTGKTKLNDPIAIISLILTVKIHTNLIILKSFRFI